MHFHTTAVNSEAAGACAWAVQHGIPNMDAVHNMEDIGGLSGCVSNLGLPPTG